jgi:hypothetical protein
MWRAVFLLATVVGVTLAASCQGLPDGRPCKDIPAGGCPIDRGGSCDDPTCSAIFLCNNGVWNIGQVCSPQDGGTAGTAGTGGGDGGNNNAACTGDGGPCTEAHLNLTGQTTDCTPDLMAPDCPVEAAEGCAECACLTGCIDFYVCTAPGWVSVAYCDDRGNLIVSRQ